MQNRLSKENSLYLKQHAGNPVNWYPWGEAALAAAKELNKPLLVSIGYSACHWCHVMAHECFEDEYIAGLMNQHFICVKVDREERPDIDQVYMEAVQMIQHSGGWPLNVFCLPDGRPFFGGTYFPPEDRGNGLIPWPQLLMRIADFYKRSRTELEGNADAIQKNILASTTVICGDDIRESWDSLLIDAAKGICGNHDDQYGGFGSAPKFPPSMSLNFLGVLENSRFLKDNSELKQRIRTVRHTTLRAMAHGGLFDQFGGGFARYSVDRHWLIPHFEKMLYDNALLVDAYTRGWLDDHDPLYAAVVEETIGWLKREMDAQAGGFYAALDADSEGEEGRYYVWAPEEIESVLEMEEDAKAICQAYNITEKGNFEHGTSNPALVDSDIKVRNRLSPARQKLLAHRETSRVHPGKDTKISTAWNCMMIRALADAGFYFGRLEWLQRARKAADFIWTEMVVEKEGEVYLKSVFYEGSGARIEGFLHDYSLAAEAFLSVAAKIDLLDAGASVEYQRRAEVCVRSALRLFKDPGSAGCFFTAKDAETPVARRKEWFDNATPSGNSALLQALSGLYALTGEAYLIEEINAMLPAVTNHAQKVASGIANALEAISTHFNGIVVIKVRPGASIEALRGELENHFWRRTFVCLNFEKQPADYQVCIDSRCFLLTNEVAEVAKVLF
ncbi:MAG: hypothetical protein ACJAT5_000151 [Lentimonas sp.]|jgi:uncharacterized protein YyaL (SSP411 family)